MKPWLLLTLGWMGLVMGGCGDEEAARPGPGGPRSGVPGQPGGDGSTPQAQPAPGSVPVRLRFAPEVHEQPWRCGERYPVGQGLQLEPLDFRLYVHDVQLQLPGGAWTPVHLEQDGTWQHRDVAMLDFEDRTGACANGTTLTRDVITGLAQPGPYRGVRLKVGVPPDLNHMDPTQAPSPLGAPGMAWSWLTGHVFVRLDARIAHPDGTRVSLPIHLGSSACAGDAAAGTIKCQRPNVGAVELTGFDPTREAVVIRYQQLLKGLDVGRGPDSSPGCMMHPDDPDCTMLLPRLGVSPGSGAPDPSQQELFVAP